MSLNELVDNILLIARNSNIGESEHLSRIQIEKWIIAYRAMLIKLDIDKKGIEVLSDLYSTTIEPIHLSKVQLVGGNILYQSDKELPSVLGVLAVRDMFGNIIQLGNYTKAKLLKYRKATCGDYIAWISNNRIYVEGGPNQLEYVSVDAVVEDPTLVADCFNPDDDFPVPYEKISLITLLIMDRELRGMIQSPSDQTNDSEDDNLNRVRYDTRKARVSA